MVVSLYLTHISYFALSYTHFLPAKEMDCNIKVGVKKYIHVHTYHYCHYIQNEILQDFQVSLSTTMIQRYNEFRYIETPAFMMPGHIDWCLATGSSDL